MFKLIVAFQQQKLWTTMNHANKRRRLFYDFALTIEQVKQPLIQSHLCNCASTFFSTCEKWQTMTLLNTWTRFQYEIAFLVWCKAMVHWGSWLWKLPCIQKVRRSNLDRKWTKLKFLWFSSAPPSKCLKSSLNYTRGAQIPGTKSPRWPNFAQWHVIFVGTNYEFVSCHLSDTCNFEVTSRFLENMCTPELCLYCFLPHPFLSIPIIQSFNSTGRSYWQHNYSNYNKTQRFNKKMSVSTHVCFWHLKACEWHFDLSLLQI